MAKSKPVRHFFTKVVGVTHRNADGAGRQDIIKRCRLHETLTLVHEDGNPQDPNAVKVCRENGEQLGYIRSELAEEIVERSQKGWCYAVFVSDLTGGTPDSPTRGVNLLVIQAQAGVNPAEAQEYANSIKLRNPTTTPTDRDGQERGHLGCLSMLGLLGFLATMYFLHG